MHKPFENIADQDMHLRGGQLLGNYLLPNDDAKHGHRITGRFTLDDYVVLSGYQRPLSAFQSPYARSVAIRRNIALAIHACSIQN